MNIRQITFWEADSLLVDVSIQSELVETLAEVLVLVEGLALVEVELLVEVLVQVEVERAKPSANRHVTVGRLLERWQMWACQSCLMNQQPWSTVDPGAKNSYWVQPKRTRLDLLELVLVFWFRPLKMLEAGEHSACNTRCCFFCLFVWARNVSQMNWVDPCQQPTRWTRAGEQIYLFVVVVDVVVDVVNGVGLVELKYCKDELRANVVDQVRRWQRPLSNPALQTNSL